MGQTVSLNFCLSGGSVVRVMRIDGEFEEFDFPCIAGEVMMQNPGYLVVHCTPGDKNSSGHRTKITIMVPEQPMLPGQPYMLYPIPDSHKKSLAKSKSFSMIKRKLESSTTPAVTPAEKRQGRRKALKLIFTRLNLATYVASNIPENSESTHQPREDGTTEQPTKEPAKGEKIEEGDEDDKSLTIQLPNPATLNFAWKPRLSMIPESPLGFHSRPETPVGLYRMDSPVAPSPLSIGSRSPSLNAAV